MTRSLRHRLHRHGIRVPWVWLRIPMVSPYTDRLRTLAAGGPCRATAVVLESGCIVPLLIR